MITGNQIAEELKKLHKCYDLDNCHAEDNIRLMEEIIHLLEKNGTHKMTREERVDLWCKLESISTDYEFLLNDVREVTNKLYSLMERIEEGK